MSIYDLSGNLDLNQAAAENLISYADLAKLNSLPADQRKQIIDTQITRASRNEIAYADVPRFISWALEGLPAAPRAIMAPGGVNLIPSQGSNGVVTPGSGDVSLWSSITKGISDIGKVATGFATGGIGGGFNSLASVIRPAGGVVAPTNVGTLPQLGNVFGSSMGGGIGGAIGTGIASYVGGKLAGAGGGCGCNARGRDPCTGQKLTHQRAKEASFFGGCCPPGYRLIRRPWARDICGRVPRMNVFNPHALARADRRMTGFARRSTVMLRDMGFHVSTTRHVKVRAKGRKRARAR